MFRALPFVVDSRTRPRGCSPAIVAVTDRPGSASCRPRSVARRESLAMCIVDLEPAGADASSRPWRPNRRVLVKAAATFSALAATFGATRVVPDRATAQESGSGATRAQRWSEEEQPGAVTAADAEGYRIAEADFPFYAIGASWEGSFGASPSLELSFSTGGGFGEPIITHAAVEDGVPPEPGRPHLHPPGLRRRRDCRPLPRARRRRQPDLAARAPAGLHRRHQRSQCRR